MPASIAEPSLELSFPSPAAPSLDDALALLDGSLQAFGRRERWSDRLLYRVNLVLDELLTNVFSHGVSSGDGPPRVRLVVGARPGAARIELVDDGVAFDPRTAPLRPAPDRDAPLPVGGLGLRFVRELSDSLCYERSGGRNRLCLTVTDRPLRAA